MTYLKLIAAASLAALVVGCGEKPPTEENALYHFENGKRKNVVTTETGLQYKVVQPGLENGVSPEGGEMVTVHYQGYFPDGSVFDSSYERGESIQFPANGVIQGWIEALQDMKTCEARILYIPGDLAYGPQGRPSIPPNATLLFNVQLIGVTKPDASGETQCPTDKILTNADYVE